MDVLPTQENPGFSPVQGIDNDLARNLPAEPTVVTPPSGEGSSGERVDSEARRANDERLQLALDAAAIGTFIWHIQEDWSEPDTRMRALLGYPSEEMLTLKAGLKGMLHPDDVVRYAAAVSKATDPCENGTLHEDIRIRLPDGTLRWLTISGRTVFAGEPPVPARMFGAAIDISARKSAEEALRLSEERYRTLFDSMDEAFCTIEVLFDAEQRPVDYRFLQVSPSFERQTGIQGAEGRRMLEIAPGHEAHWFEIYGQVAITGKSVRFEQWAGRLARWYDAYAFRLGQPGENCVGILFNDVTERKRREAHLAFLADMTEWMIKAGRVSDIVRLLGEKLGRYFGASICAFIEIDQLQDTAIVTDEWRGEDVPGLLGHYNLSNYITGDYRTQMASGNAVVVNDVSHATYIEHREAFVALQIGAFVNVPLLRDGVWCFAIGVYHRDPYAWREDEIDLLREVGARVWDKIERIRAEDNLREVEERNRIALEAAEMATWDYDVPASLLIWNDLHYRLFGLVPDGTAKTPDDFLYFVHPDDREWVSGQLRRAIEETGIYEAEFRIVRTDGRVRWMIGFGRGVGSAVPTTRMMGVMFDVTERHEARVALVESQERLRLIVENAREYAIVSMNIDRRVTSWNTGAERLLGYTEQEIVGQSADLIFTPEDQQEQIPVKEAVRALAEGRASDERWHVRKDGSRFWGSGAMMAMHNGAGTPVGLIKIFRDQTQQREAQQALERSQVELRQALQDNEKAREAAELARQAKDHFLAVLSHELRTPLMPVLMAVRTLHRVAELPPVVVDALEMIERNVRLEASFIDDLLDVTRIERGKLELQMQLLDLHEALRRAVDISNPDLVGKHQHLTVALGASRCRMIGDVKRLQQVFWNLLKNASKFTPEGGAIHVETSNRGQQIVVTVTDSGIGFSEETAEHLFGAFTQASLEITRQYGGLGLGLAIAKATVEGHRGELRGESKGEGRGATFTVKLPVLESDD